MLLLGSTGADGLGAAAKHTLLAPQTLPCSSPGWLQSIPLARHPWLGWEHPASPCANGCQAGGQGTAEQGRKQIKNNKNR